MFLIHYSCAGFSLHLEVCSLSLFITGPMLLPHHCVVIKRWSASLLATEGSCTLHYSSRGHSWVTTAALWAYLSTVITMSGQDDAGCMFKLSLANWLKAWCPKRESFGFEIVRQLYNTIAYYEFNMCCVCFCSKYVMLPGWLLKNGLDLWTRMSHTPPIKDLIEWGCKQRT